MKSHAFPRFLFNEAPPAGGDGGGGNPPPADPPAATPPAEPAPGDPQPPIPPTSARPEWFPEKYWKDGGPADVETLGKSYTELQKAFSTKNPHLAEVPDSPDGYAFKPEKLPEGVNWSDEHSAIMAKAFHGAQIGNSQAKAIAAAFVDMEAKNLADATKAYEDKMKADADALAAKWGGEEKFAAKRDGIAAFVTDQLGENPEEDATLFSNPRVVEFLGKTVDYVRALESQLGEDSLAKAKGSTAPGSSFTGGASEAQRIMSDPSHPEHEAYLKGDETIAKKVLTLLGAS